MNENVRKCLQLNEEALYAMKHNNLDQMVEVTSTAAKCALELLAPPSDSSTVSPPPSSSASSSSSSLELVSVPCFYKPPENLVCKFLNLQKEDSALHRNEALVVPVVVLYNLAHAYHLTGRILRKQARLEGAKKLYNTVRQLLQSQVVLQENQILHMLLYYNMGMNLLDLSETKEADGCFRELSTACRGMRPKCFTVKEWDLLLSRTTRVRSTDKKRTILGAGLIPGEHLDSHIAKKLRTKFWGAAA